MTASDVGRRFRDAVGRDLLVARKARDEVRTRALRSVLGAVDNAEAVPATQAYDPDRPGLGSTEVARRQLDVPTIHALLTSEIRERRDAVAEYRRGGHDESAAILEQEATVIEGYLDDESAWS